MAFDTAFNITWNQRVNKEENSMLKFIEKRKRDEEALNPPKKDRTRSSRRAMSDADLMSAVRDARSDVSGGGAGATKQDGRIRLSASDSNLRGRSRGSSLASGSALRGAGSSISSPSQGGGKKKAPPMTFEQMQEHVFNQYMNGYIKDLEKEAKEAAIEEKAHVEKIKDLEKDAKAAAIEEKA